MKGAFIVNANAYNDQIGDVESLKTFEQKEAILSEKAVNLTTQFANYLADAYPQHEKDLFKDMSPEKVSIYMVKYPEIRSSETMVKLVEEIGKLQNDVYHQRLARTDAEQRIRVRLRNPWLIHFWLPSQ